MSDPEILLKAAINRITARVTEKLINSAQDLSEIAEDIPKKVKEEWSNFKEEVLEETERLKKDTNSSKEPSSNHPATKKDLTQAQIDKLRSKVIEINKSIEEKN